MKVNSSLKSSLERAAGWDAQKYNDYIAMDSLLALLMHRVGKAAALCARDGILQRQKFHQLSDPTNNTLCHLHLFLVLPRNHTLDVGKAGIL